MSLFIVRVTETPGHMVRTRLPGDYGDGQAVMQAMNKELAKYPTVGRNDALGHWWAQDSEGREIKFVISGSPTYS